MMIVVFFSVIDGSRRYVPTSDHSDLIFKCAESNWMVPGTSGDELTFTAHKMSGKLKEVGHTSRGYTIFREPNEVGGYRYWSDSIGGGVVIWDTSLASDEELRVALKCEKDRLGNRCPECGSRLIAKWSGVECKNCDWWFCF